MPAKGDSKIRALADNGVYAVAGRKQDLAEIRVQRRFNNVTRNCAEEEGEKE
jgi:hypothetical protein